MIEFTTIILKFAEKGEKTGWTYIDVPVDVAQELIPENKRSFRAKGMLDQQEFAGVALIPMGEGTFIMPLNQALRKVIRKREGAMLHVRIEVDKDFEVKVPDYLSDCLDNEPQALDHFYKLPKSHRNYFINWIESAKTEPTKVSRIARTLKALSLGYNYGEMIRLVKDGF